MANHKDALKRNRQNQKRRTKNRHYRARMRTQIKKVRATVAAGDAPGSAQELQNAVGLIHRLATKGIIHRRQAARRISRLQRAVNNLNG